MKKFVLITVVSMLFGCFDKSDNINGEYVMIDAPDNAEITLTLQDGQFFGIAAINRYFGNYSIKGSSIKFSPAGSTMMAGPENLMKVEYEYLQNLGKIQSWENHDGRLILKDGQNLNLTFERQSRKE